MATASVTMPCSLEPDFLAGLMKFIEDMLYLLSCPAELDKKKQAILQKSDKLLDLVSLFVEEIVDWLSSGVSCIDNNNLLQRIILLDFAMRCIRHSLEDFHATADAHTILDAKRLTRLKSSISNLGIASDEFDRVIMEQSGFPLSGFSLLDKVGDKVLSTPLRIFIEDDDGGKHVSCFELPQLYGYGETEQEAVEMLEREILSLRDDVRESDNITIEYTAAANLIDMALTEGSKSKDSD